MKSIGRGYIALAAAAGLALGSATHAKTIDIPDFATDPSGPEFSIQAIGPTEGASENIVAAPGLTYGVTDPVSGVNNTLQMNWEADNPNLPAQAGWALVFGTDPDITNHVLTLSINPPGVGNPLVPGGMINVEIRIVDTLGGSTGWGFNTDQAGLVTLGNDPTAAGKAPAVPPPPPPPVPLAPPPWASLAQGVMQTVTINLGTGPVAGSALVTGGPLGPLIGPNYLINVGGANLTQAKQIEFYENGFLAGNAAIPTNLQGLNNWWDHVYLDVPAPGSILLLLAGLSGLGAVRRNRRT